MARKSKTQKAKAAKVRAEKKIAKTQEETTNKDSSINEVSDNSTEKKGAFKNLINKKSSTNKEKSAAELRQERRDAKIAAKENKKPRKHSKLVQFFFDVKAELKRVTWPDAKDVRQWTGVVIGALVFFGVYVAVLDNWIVTPILVWISSIGS